MITINKNPTRKELLLFGLLFALFFGLIGGIVLWRWDAMRTATVLWSIGGGVAVIYYLIPPLRRWIYLGWMYAAFPIGWTISHLVLALIFYGMFLPIGLIMRILGRDPMTRSLERETESYWIERPTDIEPGRYFRQF